MPAIFSHYYMAKHTKKLAENCGTVKDAYYWGAQGPDFFFFSRGIKPRGSLRKYGTLLQRGDPEILFKTFFDIYSAGGYSEITLSYIQGFICHYALDRSVHPFIYRLSQKLVTRDDILSIFLHNRIEHNIDVHVLLDEKHVGGDKVCAISVLPANREVLFEISAFMTEVVRRMFGPSARKVNQKQVFRCFKNARRTTKMLFDRTGRKQKFSRRVERILDIGPAFSGVIRPKEPDRDIDYLNMQKKTWYYPADVEAGNAEPHRESYYDMAEKAKADAVNMISDFDKCLQSGKFSDFTGHISFTTGRSVI